MQTVSLIIFLIIGVWLVALTIYIIYNARLYKVLFKDLSLGSLTKILGGVLEKEKVNSKDIELIIKKIRKIESDSLVHLQKVGFVRFNPFSELGGDQSFAVAFLDGENNGIIITGLHTREHTRVYVKRVTKAKSKFLLSGEEKKALEAALKKN